MDMNETIRDILVFIRPELEAHHEDIETHLHDDVHAIWGDRIQIQQVMLNLAMNVMEAMDGINETCRWLVIESQKHDAGHISITAWDSGPGIAVSTLDRMFEAFYSTKPQGLGMGLAISHSIIEVHDGRLWTAMNEGCGATFTFTLPLCEEVPA